MIRLATDQDRAAIAALHTRSWQDSYIGTLPDDYLHHDLPRVMADQWAQRALNDPRRLTFIDDEQRGFIHTFTDTRMPYIDNLHVDPTLRSNGIGAALLRATRDKVGPCALTVLASNTRAIAFYTREGGILGATNHETLFGHPVTSKDVSFP